MSVFCLFEQSGTFADVFREKGYGAYDYDIENQFGKTNCVVDLFEAINMAYEDKPSPLDIITSKDLVLAFFPCTRFEKQFTMDINGSSHGYKSWSWEDKIEKSMQYEKERSAFFQVFGRLIIVALKRNWRIIIENPYSPDHYLIQYFPLPKCIVTIMDRQTMGDKFKKPTMFWFIGLEPSLTPAPLKLRSIQEYGRINRTPYGIQRSLITKEFAENFINIYIGDQI